MAVGGGVLVNLGPVAVVVGDDNELTVGLSGGLVDSGARVARLAAGEVDLGALGPAEQVTSVRASLTAPEEVGRALEEVCERFGTMDSVVFSWFPPAAAQPLAMADMTDAHFDAVWEQPMRAALFCFQAAYTHMAADGGHMMAVVPTVAMSGAPFYSATAAGAEGLRLLIKSIARQWGDKGITANTLAVAPGLLIPDAPNFEQSLAERALGRVGDARTDLAPVAAFLSGDGSRFLTGSTLFLDGGLWMSAP